MTRSVFPERASRSGAEAGRPGVFLMKEKIMLEMLKQFIRDEEGVTAIEYGLIAALIAVMIIAGAKIIGVELDRVFKFVGTTLQGAPNP
ncbi:Flp family type IVb pilin [Aromatoleum petrolei]